MPQILDSAKYSLLDAARSLNPSLEVDSSGYALRLEDNLVAGVSREQFEADFCAGAGHELDSKMRAAHSSAALVVNTFSPWKQDPATLLLENSTGFDRLRFEVKLPTGLLGTSPHLDIVSYGSAPVAIESKCLEYLSPKSPRFAAAYESIADSRRESAWFNLIQLVRREPRRFQHLDVAQLVKHALGLMNSPALRDATLLYLFWEPQNSSSFHEFQRHRMEIADLERILHGARPLFRHASYPELWKSWEERSNEEWVRLHILRLKQRYTVVIPPVHQGHSKFQLHELPDQPEGGTSTPQSASRIQPQRVSMEESPSPPHISVEKRPGMLHGIDSLINSAFGLKRAYDCKTSALILSANPIALDGAALLQTLYEQIVSNWDGSKCRSRQLWRSIPKTAIAARNTSPEKTLEKAIVNWVPGWFNQIPTASGLLTAVEEKHRNVDLGHFVAPGHLELIELKVGLNADTPLKAAFEMAGYALLYCFARAYRVPLSLQEENLILQAHRIDLKVLAPKEVYQGYSLKWLESSLDAGFREFSNRHFADALELHFSFESFSEDFKWPGTPDDKLHGFLERRSANVWG